MKIGVIGTGNMTKFLLESINEMGQLDGEILSIFGRNEQAGKMLEERYNTTFYSDFKTFIHSPIDIVVEVATIDAAVMYIEEVLECKKDIIISSVGAFKDIEYLKKVKEIARSHSKHIYLPSGAIGGLDLLQSANSLNGLREVRITTRKSPESLGLKSSGEMEVLFDGVALDAIDQFPKNINVALLLSIAGIGAEKTNVRVIADPKVNRNTHTIEAKGDFGKMNLTIENTPMLTNPKTSYLAALSILSTLQNKERSISI